VIRDSTKAPRAYIDTGAISYEVCEPDGSVRASEGPFPDLGALILHVQAHHKDAWLARARSTEPF